MHRLAEKYYRNISSLISSVRVTNQVGDEIGFSRGIEMVGKLIISRVDSDRKIMFIGNGASASISSHMATDFLRNGGMQALAFNDSALLTYISNDYGYEHVFARPIEMFADEGDILVAISSSGKSENILRGVQSARNKKCKVITLSGFENANPLSIMGNFNFYVPEKSYGTLK